jgi:AraC family transcriptional regulator
MRLVAQPRVTVLEAALSVGFGSAEAFSRAFKARFGSSPSSWRTKQTHRFPANSKPDQIDRKADQASTVASSHDGVSSQPDQETFMNVTIVDRKPATVAYLRHLGPYGESLNQFWQESYYPWARTYGLLGQARYGISHDDPSITAPGQCRYDACAEVPADFVPSGKAFTTTIPGGRYAVLHFKGTAGAIGHAWASLLRDWLPSSGLQLDARPCFEYYPKDAACDPETEEFACELCIPVVPL